MKTGRRDPLKLVRSHRSDDVTAVWVPDRIGRAPQDPIPEVQILHFSGHWSGLKNMAGWF